MDKEITKGDNPRNLGNLGKRSGVIYASITNRIQEIEDRISGAEDTIENTDIEQSKKMQNTKSS